MKSLICFLAALCVWCGQLSGADRGPNIVFIMADDLGWADTTLSGHTRFYKTPNLERLAKRGMTFTRAYAASPLCSPTRSSVLTGLSPARTGITTPNCHLPQVVLQATLGKKAGPAEKAIAPTSVSRLNTTYQTLPKALKAAGYATGHFGKWHLGPEPYSPLQHGFDVDVPHWPGPGPAGSFVAPWKFKDFDPDPAVPDQHIEDRMAKEAVAFMEKHAGEPFYLNYWMFSVHAPFDAKKSLIEKYRGRVDPNDPQRSPTYAAMIESMDDAVGTLLDTLDRLKIADRTLIVFFSDNGGNMYNEVDGTTPTSNAPLRGGKATVFEGGIRVPCVVAYPGLVAAGSRSDAVIQSSDFYPTILELSGLKAAPAQRFDGISIVPALKGQPLTREAIFTYFPHNPAVPDWLPPSAAMHRDDWKLIRIFHGGENGAHRWKLFNLREDLGERNDLAAREPERVKAMDALIGKFLADTKAVVPVRNPGFDLAKYDPQNEGRSKPKAAKKPAAAAKPNIILIYSDDHGFADLGVQGAVKDIRTPNLDAMARDGVRFTSGYVSAPQCVPSRAGLLTGRYQQRFGVEDNSMGPLPLAEQTIAERLKPAGYVSCQVGKWHLEAPPERKVGKGKSAEAGKGGPSFQPWAQGFAEYFTGPMNTFAASHDLQGRALPNAPQQLTDKRFRCVWQTDAALSFIDRHQRDPFFLYLAYFTPHTPLESPEPWFSQTPADAPKERRQALAMIAAMDDGIGRIREKLRAAGIEKNTLIFFVGDNGAPLKQGAWNGSLNLPLVGEKGMLTDGGVRVPFVAAWPGTLPAGKVYDAPVINLDVAATAVALAGQPNDAKLDGVNLVPFLRGEKAGNPHDALFWRWRSQAAVRADRWKLILLGRDERFLFDLDSPEGETRNRIAEFPDIAAGLEKKLMTWNATLPPPGLPRDIVDQDQVFYDAHVNKTGVSAVKRPRKDGEKTPTSTWLARNATTEVKDGALRITPATRGKQNAFLAFSALNIPGPAIATATIRAENGGRIGIAWRLDGQKDFLPDQTAHQELAASAEFQDISINVAAKGAIIHLRLLLPDSSTDLRRFELKAASGAPVKEWAFGQQQ
ncbi:MAG: sulfatase-like hydrolase/transferase [Chthoniobacteraceae bacterium]